MAGEPRATLVGNLTDDPELRFTPGGKAVANFTIAQTPRRYNRDINDWEDGETLFMRCSVWGKKAENVAETLMKGYRVIAEGVIKQRSYETREGDKRTVVEMEVDEIGPSLTFVTAKISRSDRPSGGGGRQSTPAQPAADPWAGAGADPWASTPPKEEPPF